MPITKKQRGLFGAEYARRKRGLKPRLKGLSTEKLRHLLMSGTRRKKNR